MRVPPTIWVTPPRCESGICCAATGRAASTSSATENGLIRAAAPAIGRRRRRPRRTPERSEEHTSELQSLAYLVCRLLLEKKKKRDMNIHSYRVHNKSSDKSWTVT